MQAKFTNDTRMLLRESLEAHGCAGSIDAVIDMYERLAMSTFGHREGREAKTALHAAAQASTVLEHANLVCNELDSLGPATDVA